MKVAIAGMGFMGNKHKILLKKIPGTEIIAEIDEKHGISSYKSIENFCSKKIPADLVVVATPNYLHYKNALYLLENGYNVLVEKPFCFNLNELQNLQEASNKFQRKVFVVMQNRYSNTSVFLKNLISEKKLGQLYNLQFNAFWNRDEKYYSSESWKGKKNLDGGILYTQFSHLLDLILYIIGEKINIKYKDFSSFRNQNICEIEDTLIAVLESETGSKISLNFTNSVFEKNQETSLNIIAENGTIKIAGQYFNEITFQNIKGFEKISLEENSNEENLLKLYQEIFKNLNNEKNKALLIEDGYPLIDLLSKFYSTAP